MGRAEQCRECDACDEKIGPNQFVMECVSTDHSKQALQFHVDASTSGTRSAAERSFVVAHRTPLAGERLAPVPSSKRRRRGHHAWTKIQYCAVVVAGTMSLVSVDGESLAFVLREGRALCVPCLAEHLNASIDAVDAGCRALLVPQKRARCDNCLNQTVVHSLP